MTMTMMACSRAHLLLLWASALLVLLCGVNRADGFPGAVRHRRRLPRLAAGAPAAAAPAQSDASSELLRLIRCGDGGASGNSYSKKTPEERDLILAEMLRLEAIGSERPYLDDESLWDSYELAYFDRSVDGRDGGNNSTAAARPARSRGIASKVLGRLFGLRYSFQHVVRPNRAVNDVGVRILGLPFSVVAGGNFTRVSAGEVADVEAEFGTRLRPDTAVRIDFGEPLLWMGGGVLPPLVFRMGPRAQSPPVTLCTTYMDGGVRLALAAKGGRLVFTRGGKADLPLARSWEGIEGRTPVSGRAFGISAALVAGAVWRLVPSARLPIGLVAALPAGMLLRIRLSGSRRRFDDGSKSEGGAADDDEDEAAL